MNVQISKGSTALVYSLTVSGGFLFILFLANGFPLLFFVGCLFLGLGLYPRYYLRVISRSVFYDNRRQKMYLTKGDLGELTFQFFNNSFLPAMGTCRIAHDQAIKFVGEPLSSENKFEVPLSIGQKESVQLTLPIQTLERGLGRITTLTILLSDPLKLMKVRLLYEFVRQEVVIYPKKQAVSGVQEIQQVKEGQHIRPYSLFKDRSLPIGTRDYAHGDSLKDIHWKATARKGALQTKLVEKTIGMTWSFVVFIGSDMGKKEMENLEHQLSSMAFLSEVAHKRGIEFNLIVNTKPAGRAFILHTPFGSDRPHYFRMMERLAAVQVNFLRVKPKLALREISRNLREPRVLLMAGAVSEIIDDPLLNRWMKHGHLLYKVEPSGAVIPILKGGERLVNE